MQSSSRVEVVKSRVVLVVAVVSVVAGPLASAASVAVDPADLEVAATAELEHLVQMALAVVTSAGYLFAFVPSAVVA